MKLGLPLWIIIALGLLAAPRVVLHDLDVINESSAVNAAFVFVPLVVWVAVAVWRASNPFLALLATGGVYGVCLAVGHNIFWEAPDTDLPVWFLRVAMTVSSVFTGVAVGTICGVIAWGLRRVRATG